MNIGIVLATYNEELNIKELINLIVKNVMKQKLSLSTTLLRELSKVLLITLKTLSIFIEVKSLVEVLQF